MAEVKKSPASFRDPDGFLFLNNGVLHRQINPSGRDKYDRLMGSGLYDRLTRKRLLIEHEEADLHLKRSEEAYKIITPRLVPFISHPYEWCFSQLKDAALATLSILETSLDFGMILKDASAHNIQFMNGRPLLVDTLSLDVYDEGTPWAAYGQFCRHFLAPLALGAYVDVRLLQLLRTNLDGIPLDMAANILPARTLARPGLLIHLHTHAKMDRRQPEQAMPSASPNAVPKQSFLGLLGSLRATISRLKPARPKQSVWSKYDAETYSRAALADKKSWILACLKNKQPGNVWDLGGNTGQFARLASGLNIPTLCLDAETHCIEACYQRATDHRDKFLLPLVADLTNPSPDLGWGYREWESLKSRGPADMALALALVHHLAIGNNIPLGRLARFMASLCRLLVVEFVPKSDPGVKRLMTVRPDIFPAYTQEGFEEAFSRHFTLLEKHPVEDSLRTLYLMGSRTLNTFA